MKYMYPAPIGDYGHCRYWHQIGFSLNVRANTKHLLCWVPCQDYFHDMTNSAIEILEVGTSGLTQNICCVNRFLSGLLSWHDKLLFRNPWSQSAAVWVASNTALACMIVCTCVWKGLHMLPFHPALGDSQGFSWGTLVNKYMQTHASHFCGL